jgi:hypothetical protein
MEFVHGEIFGHREIGGGGVKSQAIQASDLQWPSSI